MTAINATAVTQLGNISTTGIYGFVERDGWEVLLISIAAGFCSFITVVGNAVVILSFLVNKSLRNFSNYLILSLAVSDITIGAFSMNVFTTNNVHNRWILGESMCKAWLSVDYTASNASSMNLLVICIDRYLAIIKPTKYKRWCTPRNAAYAIIAVWTLSFLMWVPPITLWYLTSNNTLIPEGKCFIPFIHDSSVITIATICTAFYIPATMMCGLYQRVIYKIKKRRWGIKSLVVDAKKTTSKDENITSNKKKKQKTTCLKSQGRVRLSSEESSQVNAELEATKRNEVKQKLLIACDLMGKGSDVDKSKNTVEASCCSPQIKQTLLETPNKDDVIFSPESSPDRKNVTQTTLTSNHNSSKTLYASNMEYSMRTSRTSSTSVHLSRVPENGSFRPKTHSFKENSREARERRVTVLLKFILLCFIILWLPYSLIVVITALNPSLFVPPEIWALSYWLCYLNSTVNPFCYGFCNENFRRTFKVIMTTKWWTRESQKLLRVGRHGGRQQRLFAAKKKVAIPR
ncbi:muscarinic acetylcholine receptor M1-like [Clavelina lepadiformis]|uniref:muscarinic acetylcholine receptor M1-like n=1 Tax=Clavelina lepadiformis TaxID=159417 RepID=UPI004042A2F0